VGIAILAPGEALWTLPLLPKAEIGMEIAPAIIGVGFILGFRQSGVILAGAAVSALALTPLIAYFGEGLDKPLLPETKLLVRDMGPGDIWGSYIRYIGAGSVALAGLATVIAILPALARSFGAVLVGVMGQRGGGGSGSELRMDRDLPPWVLLAGVAIAVLAPMLIPGILAGPVDMTQRVAGGLCVLFFGILFVTVAARIVGLVGVTSQPTSGVIILTILGTASLFLAMGWTTPGMNATVITIGTIVGIAASKSGDSSQDMKTGWLIGATPARQQFSQLLGIATACWAVAFVLPLMHATYGFGSSELRAPQANLMKTIVDGVLSQNLPWGLVLTGAGISLGAILCGVSGLAFAIGVYLSFSAMAPVFVGGCVRALADRAAGRRPAEDSEDSAAAIAERETNPGILAASGLVAGEGLAGIVVVIMRFLAKSSNDSQIVLWGPLKSLGASYQSYLDAHKDPIIHGTIPYLGSLGNLASMGMVLGVCVLLYVAGCRRGSTGN
jgi:putative OPT family oligopeptide transporter